MVLIPAQVKRFTESANCRVCECSVRVGCSVLSVCAMYKRRGL